MKASTLPRIVEEVRSALEARLHIAEGKIQEARATLLNHHGILASSMLSSCDEAGRVVSYIDYDIVQYLSAYVTKHGSSIKNIIWAWNAHRYCVFRCTASVSTAVSAPQPIHKNHASTQTWESALLRSIGEGQQMVPTPGVDAREEDRVIHDLPHPRGNSTNDWTNQDCIPPVTYTHVYAIARRILELRKTYPGKYARSRVGQPIFRRIIPQHDLTILDLSLPFGWTGSPAYYGVFGAAVLILVQHESPSSMDPASQDPVNFFCYDWVDDHVLIEPSTQDRLTACEATLRLAMMAVLDPRAMNEKKFTQWSTKLTALGLEWDTEAVIVSMPERKIEKAQIRIKEMCMSSSTTRSALENYWGVCVIFVSKLFFQRLVSLWRKSPRFGSVALPNAARLDLNWFEAIVTHGWLRSVPLTMFNDLPTPAVEIYMDASDEGLCVLNPTRHELLRI
ncbi:hypothetical protein PHMEG_0005532 [Phytophthora megakarya]|uniref:Reverse transcriptase n=1 Tax=Phytophthora megakarya TaxID=4795 RepID=A0A225WQZ4_9STRA|nr:hypothetical protein PHMEG_0005532 [Phytophthora megakarya]